MLQKNFTAWNNRKEEELAIIFYKSMKKFRVKINNWKNFFEESKISPHIWKCKKTIFRPNLAKHKQGGSEFFALTKTWWNAKNAISDKDGVDDINSNDNNNNDDNNNKSNSKGNSSNNDDNDVNSNCCSNDDNSHNDVDNDNKENSFNYGYKD